MIADPFRLRWQYSTRIESDCYDSLCRSSLRVGRGGVTPEYPPQRNNGLTGSTIRCVHDYLINQ